MRKINEKRIVGMVSTFLLVVSYLPLHADIGLPAGGDIEKTVVRTTSWGKSSDVVNNLTFFNSTQETVYVPSRALTDVLSTIFPGGVYKIFAFDEFTPSLSVGSLTLLVAVGGDTVAIINSGEGSGCITPTQLFTTSDAPNVFVFQGGALSGIAPLTSVEIVRDASNAYRGYLYVGGAYGVARLQRENGDGWNNVAGLTSECLDTNFTSNYSFVNVPAFTNQFVVAMQSLNSDLVVLSTEKIMYAPAQDTIDDTSITTSRAAKYGTDLIVTPDWAIFATTAGVFWTDSQLIAAPKLLMGITDTPISLAYVSETKGVASSEGNLFVLMVNRDNDRGSVLKFYVNSSGIQPIAGVSTVVNWNQYRRDISTDGLSFFSSRVASNDQTDLLQLSTNSGKVNSLTSAINVPTGTKYAGRPVRDPASGGWVVPGQSVRVNE